MRWGDSPCCTVVEAAHRTLPYSAHLTLSLSLFPLHTAPTCRAVAWPQLRSGAACAAQGGGGGSSGNSIRHRSLRRWRCWRGPRPGPVPPGGTCPRGGVRGGRRLLCRAGVAAGHAHEAAAGTPTAPAPLTHIPTCFNMPSPFRCTFESFRILICCGVQAAASLLHGTGPDHGCDRKLTVSALCRRWRRCGALPRAPRSSGTCWASRSCPRRRAPPAAASGSCWWAACRWRWRRTHRRAGTWRRWLPG